VETYEAGTGAPAMRLLPELVELPAESKELNERGG